MMKSEPLIINFAHIFIKTHKNKLKRHKSKVKIHKRRLKIHKNLLRIHKNKDIMLIIL